MSLSNGYITRAEFLTWLSSQTATTNTLDDSVIDQIIDGVCKYINARAGRKFYPSIMTRKFNVPDPVTRQADTLLLDDDLLSVTTLVNGDTTTITSTDYILLSGNETPYWGVKIKSSSTVAWLQDSSGNSEQTISVSGYWGYHNDYPQAWLAGGTLGVAITSTTALTFTATAGHLLAIGQIIKIGDEIMNVSNVATNVITVIKRGDNGSAAATHLITTPVYIWNTITDIKLACYQITSNLYQKRNGQGVSSDAIITPQGVVIPPKDIPSSAVGIIQNYMRLS